jgi:hypothetical protein
MQKVTYGLLFKIVLKQNNFPLGNKESLGFWKKYDLILIYDRFKEFIYDRFKRIDCF